MRVGRFTSVAALGAMIVVALGLLASPAVGASPGSRGMAIVSVRAIPAQTQQHGGQVASLARKQLNVVTVSAALGFKVTLRNQDASQRANVTATLAIERVATQGGPLVEERTLAVIGPKQTKTIIFGHVGQVPFASRTNLTVRVTSGRLKVYPIIFSLPSGTTPAGPIHVQPVPSVVGLDQQEAISKLQAKGYEILIAQAYSRRPVGVVVGQADGDAAVANANESLRDRIVRITVSEGKKPRFGG